jgi:hypothetical protein
MRATRTRSVVVGTLDDERAHKTIADLRNAGFDNQQIGLAMESGELIVQDAALARADVAGHGLVNVLVEMGVPEGDAGRYAQAFAASRAIVTVQTQDRSTEAATILRSNRAESVQHW